MVTDASKRRVVHPDVEFHVTSVDGARDMITRDLTEAHALVFNECLNHGSATLDVVVWSEAGARAFGGASAVEEFNEDPEASVFERIEFKCSRMGRVP